MGAFGMSTEQQSESEQQRRREIAAELGCITREDFCVFAGYTRGTEETNRKRGVAPPHVVMGTVILYPLDTLAAFIRERVKSRVSSSGRSLL
jgi:hypothetical protein